MKFPVYRTIFKHIFVKTRSLNFWLLFLVVKNISKNGLGIKFCILVTQRIGVSLVYDIEFKRCCNLLKLFLEKKCAKKT